MNAVTVPSMGVITFPDNDYWTNVWLLGSGGIQKWEDEKPIILSRRLIPVEEKN